jgi:hypothetical protein
MELTLLSRSLSLSPKRAISCLTTQGDVVWDEREEVFSHPRRDLTWGWRSTCGSQSVTARRWAVVLTMVESICAVNVATVSRTDGMGVEGAGRRSSGR